ncbi:MAG TPA: hypothetical protein VLF18_02700 [Tahibacter sp.]|uniref:hypothetical protein n=1 Tax=Tahibacter sp. TaxID=2056211 RepID=UPI002D0AE564|nr:hypothetical protein [Tahibacter sp.]HSX59087.1 hypothetical protein [Tahibacter sp.]
MRIPLLAACVFSAAAYAPAPARADMMIGGSANAGENHPLRRFHPDAIGNDAPVGEVSGSSTQLYQPMFGVYEPAEQVIYISDFDGRAVRVYPAFATGDVAPLRVLNPPELGQTRANAPVPAHGELGVIAFNCCIYTYPLKANGNEVERIRGIAWGGGANPTTRLNNPTSLTYLPATDEYAVKDYSPTAPQTTYIVFHARTANGVAAPTRLLTGPGVADALGMAYDANSRRLFVLRQAPADMTGIRRGTIAIFADTASGDATPMETIEGNATQLDLPNGRTFTGIGFDPYTSRLMVASRGNSADDNRVVLFDYTAGVGGNVAPVRVVQGSNVSPYSAGIPFGVPAGPPDSLFADGFQP